MYLFIYVKQCSIFFNINFFFLYIYIYITLTFFIFYSLNNFIKCMLYLMVYNLLSATCIIYLFI